MLIACCALLLPALLHARYIPSRAWQFPDDSTAAADTLAGVIDEDYLEEAARDDTGEGVPEELDARTSDPIPLATATSAQLAELPGIDASLARTIIAARRRGMRLASAADLQRITGMNDAALAALLRYATFTPEQRRMPRHPVELRMRVRQDDRFRQGFSSSAFPGDRLRTSTRLKLSPFVGVDGGIITEKDAGEVSFTDHLAGYVRVRDAGMLESLVLGTYTISAAQGVVFWKPWGAQRRMDAAAPLARSSTVLSPFLSTSEYGAYRGVAANARAGPLTILAFYGDTPLDARIDSLGGFVTSFDRSGLHRTTSERAKLHTVRERVLGGRVEWCSPAQAGTSLLLGISGYASSFSRPIDGSLILPTDAADPAQEAASVVDDMHGWSHTQAFGVDIELAHENLTAFTEVGMMRNARVGGVAGLLTRLSESVSTSLVYRHYPAGFESLHGRAAGSRSGGGGNSAGIWLGMSWSVRPGLRMQWMFDRSRRPGASATLPFPASQEETGLRVEWRLSPAILTSLFLRMQREDERTVRTDGEGRSERVASERLQENLRAEITMRASARASLRLRVEQTRVRLGLPQQERHGFLGFAELRIRPLAPLALTARMSAFGTQSYDARVYIYETDAPGMGMSSAMYGSGVRMHVTLSLELSSRMSIWASYGQSIRDGARSLGSGHDLVNGDALGAGTLQCDLRW